MQTCNKCGSPMPDGAMFCSNCGAPAAPPEPPRQESYGSVCPNCGAPLTPGSAFCTACGAPAGASRPESAAPEAPEKSAAPVCPNCGAPLTPGSAFCTTCGAPAGASRPESAAPEAPEKSAAPVCPNCGAPLTPGSAFCTTCGAPAGASRPESAAPEAPEKSAAPVCPNCGAPLTPGSAFCTACGAPAGAKKEEPARSAASSVFCTTCGAKLSPGSTFCPNCGAALSSAGQTQSRPTGFCTACGAPLTPGSGFCTACGAPAGGAAGSSYAASGSYASSATYSQSAAGGGSQRSAPPKKKGHGGLIAGIIIALVLLGAAAFLIFKYLLPGLSSPGGLLDKKPASPEEQFVSYQQGLLADRLLSRMETGLNAAGNFSLSTDLLLSASVNNSQINKYLKNSSVGLKLDLSSNSLIANGELTLMGSPVLSAYLTCDGEELGFCLPELDSNYYVMDLSKMAEKLSIPMWAAASSQMTLPEISGKELRALIQAYLDVFNTVVTKDNVTLEENAEFDLNQLSGSYKGNLYTFKPSAEDVEAMLTALADRLEKDKDLRSLALKLLEAAGEKGLEDDLEDALIELAGQLRDNAASIGEKIEEFHFTWTLGMEGNRVRMIQVQMKNSDEKMSLGFESAGGKDGEQEELIYLTVDKQTMSLSNTYTASGKAVEGKVSFTVPSYDDSVRMTLDYDIDKSKLSPLGFPYGSYSFRMDDYDIRFTLDVEDGKEDSTDHILTLKADSSYFDDMFDTISLTINATRTGTAVPPSSRATDISGYSEEQFEALFNSIEASAYTNLLPVLMQIVPNG